MNAALDAGFALRPSEAISFFRQKANKGTKQWGELAAEAHARQFAVAGATSNALLNDFKSAINKALTDGTTLLEFRKDFDRIVGKHGWSYKGSRAWRSEIIYRTNLSSAYAAGRYRKMTSPEALEIFPYWRYVHNVSLHPRIVHEAWGGIILRADNPWWNSHFAPNGWGCNCEIQPVSRRKMARNGWKEDEAPEVVTRPWVNPATGKTEQVPTGISPGFQTNPGKVWMDEEARRAAVALKPVTAIEGKPPAAAPPEVRRSVQKKEIRKLLDTRAGVVEAATAPETVIKALNVETDSVLLSDDTLSKNLAKHPELKEDAYVALPEIFEDLTSIKLGKEETKAVALGRWDSKLFRLAIKRTGRGEIFLTSFLKVSEAEAERIAAASKKIKPGD
ncbi:Phage-Mu-F domain-containing protein [Acetobacteraceae bacterium EV16G]|uniref:Phage-Mu-F domain-containing protein n=2 Tax=Sorlinia euscelidii TaxID=3081148 RepID=A0ABU7TZT8_9PROT